MSPSLEYKIHQVSSSHLLNLFRFKGGDVPHNQVLNGDVHVDDVLAKEGCEGERDLTQCGECQSEELQKGPKAEFQGLGCLIIIRNNVLDDDEDQNNDNDGDLMMMIMRIQL